MINVAKRFDDNNVNEQSLNLKEKLNDIINLISLQHCVDINQALRAGRRVLCLLLLPLFDKCSQTIG